MRNKLMYKCKECGAEYEQKPDYCDCGNNEFEWAKPEEDIQKNSDNFQAEEAAAEKIIVEESKVQSAAPNNFNYSPKHNEQSALASVNLFSLTIFIICILLSLYVIFFAWNPSEKDFISKEKQDTPIPVNIPSIDKIWNNTLPVIKQEGTKKAEVFENIIKQVAPAQVQKKTEQKQTYSIKPKTTTVSLKKATQTKKQTIHTITKQQSTVNAQEQAKKTSEEAAKKKAEQERLAAEAVQIKILQAEQAKKAAEVKAKQDAHAKQELINYKTQLRNTIGRKIDFTRVIGDGSCTVSFRIDSGGRLINRSFSKQSSNNTLNDAVYNAVMATPTFNPPPSAYNNELLNLNIRFNNGNFEISLP